MLGLGSVVRANSNSSIKSNHSGLLEIPFLSALVSLLVEGSALAQFDVFEAPLNPADVDAVGDFDVPCGMIAVTCYIFSRDMLETHVMISCPTPSFGLNSPEPQYIYVQQSRQQV
jgi:hypothetical protein